MWSWLALAEDARCCWFLKYCGFAVQPLTLYCCISLLISCHFVIELWENQTCIFFRFIRAVNKLVKILLYQYLSILKMEKSMWIVRLPTYSLLKYHCACICQCCSQEIGFCKFLPGHVEFIQSVYVTTFFWMYCCWWRESEIFTVF